MAQQSVRDGVPIRGEIPRYKWTDPEAWKLLAAEEPVILLETGLADSTLGVWTPEYLKDNLKGDCHVFSHFTHKTKYYDQKRHIGPYKWNEEASAVSWTTSAETFYELLRADPETKNGKDRSNPKNMKWHYLQESLTTKAGDEILDVAKKFKWELITVFQAKLGLGEIRTNMLLVGPKGINTPAHYDEQSNFFYQVHGRKEMLLWSPNDFGSMYPYPVNHSHDRQSQVDLDSVNGTKFPKFRKAAALRGIVGPGEVMYIPAYWWHDVTSLDETVSITFWMMAQGNNSKFDPTNLGASSFAAMRRNLEKMISTSCGPLSVEKVLKLACDRSIVEEVAGRDGAAGDAPQAPTQNADVVDQHVFSAKQCVSLVKMLLPDADRLHQFFSDLYTGRFQPDEQ